MKGLVTHDIDANHLHKIKEKNKHGKIASLRAVNSSSKSCVCFSMFTGLLIDYKRILETLKIVGLNPCATRIHQTLKPKISKIGLRLDRASRTSALDHRSCALDCTTIDLLLLRANAGVFDPCLGHSSAGALDRRVPALDHSHKLQLNF